MSKKIERIAEAGRAFYGERWQAALARASGVSITHFNNVIVGRRTLKSELERAVADALGAEAIRLKKSIATVDRIRAAILRDLGD